MFRDAVLLASVGLISGCAKTPKLTTRLANSDRLAEDKARDVGRRSEILGRTDRFILRARKTH